MRSFYFKLFHKAIWTNQFLHRIGIEVILPIVTFVIIHQKLFYTYFVNVKKFPPFGMNYVFWLIMFLGNLLSHILKKCSVSQTSQSMTVELISSFYAWNFIFTQWRHQKFFCGGGASRGQNAILRGQKSKNLPKMADFGHFFLLTGGKWGGAEPPTGGHFPPCPPLIPPLSSQMQISANQSQFCCIFKVG